MSCSRLARHRETGSTADARRNDTTAQPFLAISGIGECKGYWIGALPVPPEEPEESDDEDNGAAAEVQRRRRMSATPTAVIAN